MGDSLMNIGRLYEADGPSLIWASGAGEALLFFPADHGSDAGDRRIGLHFVDTLADRQQTQPRRPSGAYTPRRDTTIKDALMHTTASP
jgi:hypothetical protein